MTRLVRHPAVWGALTTCLIAGYYSSRVLAAARTITVTLPSAESTPAMLRPLASAADSLSIWEAVELDPFREDRAPAGARYRLPRASADTDRVVDEEVPLLILVGTVMSSDGSGFALCQRGDEPPRLVRPGQTIGGLTLQRVYQARATFASADGRLSTLTVSKGGPP